jgi:hypothetical protein
LLHCPDLTRLIGVYHQLLIDLQTVKACLLRLPGDSLITSRCTNSKYHFLLADSQFCAFSYTRSLTKSTTRLEALLKVIVTPVVRSLPLTIDCMSLADFLSGSARRIHSELHSAHRRRLIFELPEGNRGSPTELPIVPLCLLS